MDIITLGLAKKYVDDTLKGSGALKGEKGDKGDAGFSPIITENVGNTENVYKLDITTADGTIITPNLKGGAGTSTNLIDDNEISENTTYSSVMIEVSLAEVLEEGKTYTLEEVGKALSASYKVVPSVSDVTETKWIYLIANANSYDLYIFEEPTSKAVKIGNTTIDLSDYYTKSESDNTFATKEEVQEVAETIDNIETYKELMLAEYEALSEEEKNNGTMYLITDGVPTETKSLEWKLAGSAVGLKAIPLPEKLNEICVEVSYSTTSFVFNIPYAMMTDSQKYIRGGEFIGGGYAGFAVAFTVAKTNVKLQHFMNLSGTSPFTPTDVISQATTTVYYR